MRLFSVDVVQNRANVFFFSVAVYLQFRFGILQNKDGFETCCPTKSFNPRFSPVFIIMPCSQCILGATRTTPDRNPV